MEIIKRLITLCTFSIICALSLMAQTKWKPMVMTLTAYDQEGRELRKSYGFTYGGSDYVATTYDAIVGSAKLIATSGNQRFEVERIAGINALYNIAKLKLSTKLTTATLASTHVQLPAKAKIMVGQKFQPTMLTGNTPFNGYNFYTLSAQTPSWAGLPLYSDKGQIIAMVQSPSSKASTLHAIDIKAIEELKITPMSLGEVAYKGITIPRWLPETLEEANTYLYLMLTSSHDPKIVATAITDYLTLFPTDASGYIYKAENEMRQGHREEAENAIYEALKYSDTTDAIYYNWAKILLKTLSQTADTSAYKIILTEALEAVNKAYAQKSDPLYALLQAECLVALEQNAAAKDKYIEVARSSLGEAQHYLLAVQALQRVANDYATMKTWLTEGLAKFIKPYPSAAAPFLLQRGLVYQRLGKHREAIADLLEYERIAPLSTDNKRLQAGLYAMRYQSAFEAKLYQQALHDAEALVALFPEHCAYRMQRAVVWAVVGERSKALADCEWVNKQCPNNVDAYMWQVFIYTDMKQKAKVKAALAQIKTLDAKLYETLAKKYK